MPLDEADLDAIFDELFVEFPEGASEEFADGYSTVLIAFHRRCYQRLEDS